MIAVFTVNKFPQKRYLIIISQLHQSFSNNMQSSTLILCSLISYTLSAPSFSVPSFVVATPGPTTDIEIEPLPPTLLIYKLHVTSNITNRFAHTLINSKVKNYERTAAEAIFSVIIPDTAYISGFMLEVDGKKYEAHVKEKGEAKNIYNQVRWVF